MKKIILLFLIAIQFANATEKDSLRQVYSFKKYYLPLGEEEDDDCDSCGCSATGGSMGFSSMLNNNFVGVRYIYQSYTTKEGVFKDSPWVDENFNTVQIWSRIPITERIQLTALLPYHSNNRDLSTGPESISGIGDITVMGMYTIFETMKDSTTYTHKFQFGGGVKAPTGKYSTTNAGTLNPSFQLGTGSWDFPIISEYVVKREQLGLNATMSYVFKTENKNQYQYGNQFNYGTTLFYLLDFDKIKLVPQAGVAGEVYASNKQVQQDVIGTKGDILFSKFGLELGRNKLSLGLNAMVPINQNLTAGNVKANYRFGINVNYQL